jgi:hypothetical protein
MALFATSDEVLARLARTLPGPEVRDPKPEVLRKFAAQIDGGFDWSGAISAHPNDKVSLVNHSEGRKLPRQQAPSAAWLFDRFRSGATVILDDFDRLSPDLYRWTAMLEARLGRSMHVNCYISPPGSRGLPPHTDGYDVLVLQLVGRKYWTFARIYPGPSQQVDPQIFRDTVASEFTVEPGDLLIVPAGTAHQANTASTASVHLTFGVHPFDTAMLASILTRATARMNGDAPLPVPGEDGADIFDVLQSEAFRSAVSSATDALWPSQRRVIPVSFNSMLANANDGALEHLPGSWVPGHEGDAKCVDDLLPASVAERVRAAFERVESTAVDGVDGRHNSERSLHSADLATAIADDLRAAIADAQGGAVRLMVSPFVQVFEYAPGDFIEPHCDASKAIGEGVHSTHTLIHYIDGDCTGGGTMFHDPNHVCAAKAGRTILFECDRVRHSAQMVFSGTKAILRCDIHLSLEDGA